ncbi:MAG: LPS-assembly protein LptD [Prevotella sp.]|nr:LPS-assembly protein LptD [Prevotella sp.]
MRRKSVIVLLLSVILFSVAGNRRYVSLPGGEDADSVAVDSMATEPVAVESTIVDSVTVDSIELAIRLHNQAVDDSIQADSLNRAKSKGIDSPVKYSAEDSIVYHAGDKRAYLFGSSKVKYSNMDLSSEKVYMSLDSNLVHATGSADSTGALSGTPIFKMGSDTYESDTMAFNFKTKRGLISNVYTQQEDGFLKSERSKRDSTGYLYLKHGRYTTCDEEHPDFYIALSRAKVRPCKDVVFGPAYLVVADVPLPLAIPYGFFPFTKSYSSGFIMPTYGDETSRGFYLRDGGYYFAMSDKWDLKLLGEIYTKGSWGISAASNYNKRYRYSGSFYFSYQDTRTGDRGMPDYTKTESFKLQWSHRQDAKANPFSTFSASVNFASTSYERNNLNSLYNPQALTQSTRTSSINWTTTFSSLNMTLSGGSNISQNMRDSMIDMTLPDLNINVSRFYPFKRKKSSATERWYEKISLSYTGQIKNSISTKENQLLKSNLVKDWKNGMQHSIPVSASFTLFKYLTLTPSLSFTDRMYTNKEKRSWDETTQTEKRDTTYGFYNVYNWNMSVSATTKLYGFYIPSRKIFGDKIQAVRHVLTPQVGFSYAPDFSTSHYGYYDQYVKTDADGNVSLVEYSPYSSGIFSVPGKGKTGMITMSLSNNIEMKVKSEKDSTGIKKVSIIDELGARMNYNMAAETRPWSDLTMNLRLKWWKNYTFNMSAVFATYAYELDENGRPYVGTRTEYSKGRFGRFQGMSQNFSFTLNPDKLKKLFGRGGDTEEENTRKEDNTNEVETNIDDDMERGKSGARKKAGKAQTDDDGYMLYSMPWSLTIGYGITMRENTSGTFNKDKMRYPYKYTQNLNFSGNIRVSDGWNISFSSGYDFEYHKLSMTTASLSRDLHCFSMSCQMVLMPYTSYNFSFRCNAATLTDALKYDKRSSYTNAVQWY